MPGPVPKRSDQRRRKNKTEGPEPVKAPTAIEPPAIPEPDSAWHPIARDWFVSLGKSGQHAFYEPSDWTTARYVAEAMSKNLNQYKFSSMLFAAVMAASTELLTTEGARRRLRVELERGGPVEIPPEVPIMAQYRRNVGNRAG